MSEICEYCGDTANTRDHLFPRGWTGVENSRLRDRGPWVWACLDCNVRLGDVGLHTVEERASYVKDLLRKRHAKLLAQGWPDMSDWDELGPGLRQHRVKRGLKFALITSRLAYPERADWERDPAKVKQVAAWANLNFIGDDT